jgi:hypothetical protein
MQQTSHVTDSQGIIGEVERRMSGHRPTIKDHRDKIKNHRPEGDSTHRPPTTIIRRLNFEARLGETDR